MAQLDKTFPTMDCSMCILAPKMIDCSHHHNVKLLSYSEIKAVKGKTGDFVVTVLHKPRYIDLTKCTGCGVCAEHCPVEVPNEFDEQLGTRKAVYMPFPQAVPRAMTVDKNNCIECGLCTKACPAYLKVDQSRRIASDECIGCNSCVAACPVPSALSMGLPGRRPRPSLPNKGMDIELRHDRGL